MKHNNFHYVVEVNPTQAETAAAQVKNIENEETNIDTHQGLHNHPQSIRLSRNVHRS